MLEWLGASPEFPPVERAMMEPSGLLAVGGELTPEWLLAAYCQGIFPWYAEGEPVLWWSPDPRLVLVPAELRISRSLGKTLKRHVFEVRFDTAFNEVIRACALPREGASGTWITPEMQRAYIRMHELGHAHSVEAWSGGELVGGLYGIALGKVFFGESMFSRRSDASKTCLAYLAKYLESRNFAMIDCQMTTAHLQSMGAREISRDVFCRDVAWMTLERSPGAWPADAGKDYF